MTQAIDSPKPWPVHITSEEFERHVRRLFEGKMPSELPAMTVVSGPSGAGKTTFGYGLMAQPKYQNTVLIDWNENMLVHLDGYKADKANGLPMNEVYDRNVEDCIFLTGLLMTAALGAPDHEVLKKYDLDKEKLAIMRKYAQPKSYDIIISTVLGGESTRDGVWNKSPHYTKTLFMIMADFDDCKKRIKRRGGWLKNSEEQEAMQWFMDEAKARENFNAFYKYRDANVKIMGENGTISFHALSPSGTAPVQIAIKPKGKAVQILNQKLWDHFMAIPNQAAPVPQPGAQ